jgi:hypothetical protein
MTASRAVLSLLMVAALTLPARADDRGVAVRPVERVPAQVYTNSWAVVVGVDRFRSARIPPLSYAVNDARSIARALLPLGFRSENIHVLVNEEATRGAIERVLSSVVRRAAKPDDRLFVFFATHGLTMVLPHGGEEGYLLGHDSDPDDLPLTAISMQALKQIGQRIPAKHILVAVDACYSGFSLVRASPPATVDQRYLDLVLRSRAIQILTAGRRDQPVIEDQGHGVFTRTLLAGLAGHADQDGDAIITAAELGAWMHPRVAQASGFKQDMQWGSLDGEGQFVFLVPRPAAPAETAATAATRGVTPPEAVRRSESPAPVASAPTPAPPAAPAPAAPAATSPVSAPVAPEAPPVVPVRPAAPEIARSSPPERVAPLTPPPAAHGPLLGRWEGALWGDAGTNATAVLTLAAGASGLEGSLGLHGVHSRLAASLGHDEILMLLRHAGPTRFDAVAVQGGWVSARGAGDVVRLEAQLSKDGRVLRGTTTVEGIAYGVELRRK